MTGLDTWIERELQRNRQRRTAGPYVRMVTTKPSVSQVQKSNLSDPYSLGDEIDSTIASNLSHQNPFPGVTTPAWPETQPQTGILPQEEASWDPPAPRTQLIWAAVDLDGTLSEGVWTPESNGRDIGDPIWRNVDKLWALTQAGYKIVIHTARGWEHYEAIESWLNYYDIPYSRIVCGKLLAAVYVDDRAVESEQLSWLPAVQQERQRRALEVAKSYK